MSDVQVRIEGPVAMCRTDDLNFWCHGWVDKRKFKGKLLSEANSWGDYEPRDIFVGKVIHGWIISVAGDTSGCGWDTTTYFQKDEPTVIDGTSDVATVYEHECLAHGVYWDKHDWDTMSEDDCSEEEHDATVVDGPHKATWWEP